VYEERPGLSGFFIHEHRHGRQLPYGIAPIPLNVLG
jgi:hypothetical protein